MSTPKAPLETVEIIYIGGPVLSITLVVCCPYCGKLHHHGGGTDPNAWQRYVGHRESHCHPGGTYAITPGPDTKVIRG